MSDDLPDALRIGDWRFLPRRHELQRDGERRRLPRRLALVLAELARTPGQPVERGVLLAAAWRRRGVDEEALSRAVAELRQALGDDAREPRYIETIPKGGYRLIAAVARDRDDVATTREPATERHDAGIVPDVAEAPAHAAAPTHTHAHARTTQVPADASAPARARQSLLAHPTIWLAVAATLALFAFGITQWRPLQRGTDEIAGADTWTAARLAREHPFLSAAGSERDPRFSPDGRWLAFVRREPDASGAQVWVAQRDGGAARALTAEPGRYAAPAFVPGSSDLAYERRSDEGCDVWRQAMFGNDPPQRIAACAARADASGLDWSRDGQRLLLVAPGTTADSSAIAVLEAGSNTLHRLTTPTAGDGPDALPRFSPDGRHVVFVRGGEGERRLLQLDLHNANAAPRALIDDRNRIDGLAFTPDGSRLVLATDRHDYRALIALDPRNGMVQRLGGRGAEGLDIAADGTLLYVQKLYIANLWISTLPASTDSPQRLTQGTRYVSQPALSPDGRHVAYVSTGEGRETVWLRDLDDGSERRLPLDPALRWVRPAFAPDGTALWLTGYGDDGAHAWRHELASGHTTRLDGAAADAVALRAGDAAHRVIARPQGTHFALLRLRGDEAQAIAGTDAVDEFQLAAHWLAFVPSQGALQLLDLDHPQGAAREVAQIGDDNRYDWHLHADALYFVSVEKGAPLLQRLNLRDASVQSLGPLAPNTAGPSLQVTRDGKRAIFGRVERVDVDLMMAEP